MLDPADAAGAARVAASGIIGFAAAGDRPGRRQLLFLLSRAEEEQGRPAAAAGALGRGRGLAQRPGEEVDLVAADGQLLRLAREQSPPAGTPAGTPLPVDPAVRDELVGLLRRLPDSAFLRQKHAARWAAAEVGMEHPDLMTKVLRIVGLGAVPGQPDGLLVEALERWAEFRPDLSASAAGLLAEARDTTAVAGVVEWWIERDSLGLRQAELISRWLQQNAARLVY